MLCLWLFQPGGLTESSRGLARDVFWPTPGTNRRSGRTPAGVQETGIDSFRHPCWDHQSPDWSNKNPVNSPTPLSTPTWHPGTRRILVEAIYCESCGAPTTSTASRSMTASPIGSAKPATIGRRMTSRSGMTGRIWREGGWKILDFEREFDGV
jgi:hypothetical protein